MCISNDLELEKRASAIHALIPPTEKYVEFNNVEEKVQYLKTHDLISKTATDIKQFFYNGAYAEYVCPCEIVGYINNNVLVISLDKHLHCVDIIHFKEMQKSKECQTALATIPIYTDGTYEYIKKLCTLTFKESPYVDIVSTKLNISRATSIVFCGLKAFDCTAKKDKFLFCLKNDYFSMLNEEDIPVEYEIKNIKSLKDFTRIFISKNFYDFQKFVDYIFTFCEKYVDEHYIPDHLFDCCHRYMECSDKIQCTCPDYLYSKGCTYRKKLEKGIVFFGKNRNIK